ncbi:MAG TPA: SMP-30/gluconolactonase/LRE family protein [Solirubrobacteraceae bacterium]|jgi:sugar lactone lactonase YvrE|nr:SMP-30/gluconolactonase/LRE family protein [Solirubrobacteraceae bacterium]
MSTANPLDGFSVDREQITFVGHDLQRPECVLAEPDGTLWSADARGGVMRIDRDGTQALIAQSVVEPGGDPDSVSRYILDGTLPNGLAFDRDGNFIIANFGTDAVERMTRDGVSETLLEEIDGQPLGKANFALTDSRGRIWITVHTRQNPWLTSVNDKLPDGYILLIDEAGARVAADGFIGTNEIRFDASEEWLYVVESNARHVSRLSVANDGTLSHREVYGAEDLGGIPDGFAFDVAGNLWITLVNADRLVALTPELELLTLLDDGDPGGVAAFDEAFFAGTMTPEILGGGRGTLAPLMASVTFGGPDLKTVYLGSLMGNTLPSFRSPVAGLPMSHWYA